MNTLRLGDVEIHLVEPVPRPVAWVGQDELLRQVLACWTTITQSDLPLCPRIVGKPGMGKTTLAQAAGHAYDRPVFIFQCTMDTRPEDLLITPVISESGAITYHASSLVTAMLSGGVAILDEANRMSEKSWASLAPLLDNRRYAESQVAGVRVEAADEFRCCVTMNDDASTYEIPEYIISRIQPMITLEYPDRNDELAILRYNVDFAPDDLISMCADFLQQSHRYRLDYSTRDGIHIMRYALKLEQEMGHNLKEAFDQAVTQVLGEGADDMETRARGTLIDDNMVSFESFFGSIGDPGEVPGGERPEEADDDEDDA